MKRLNYLYNKEKYEPTVVEPTYTENELEYTVTIVWNSTEDFVLVNNVTSTAYVSKVEVAYELPKTN